MNRSYEPRTYRHTLFSGGLVTFQVRVVETDLLIKAERDLAAEAAEAVKAVRREIERYAHRDPVFLTSLEPHEVREDAPPVVREMSDAGRSAGVGPMAAVAGAIAEYVGRVLLPFSEEVIVENGGDIFMKTKRTRTMGIYAGASPLSERVGIEIEPEWTPMGICTSSGTVGHSKSFGQADAAVILSSSTALADAVATAVGNRVGSAEDIPAGIEFARSIEGVEGVVIIMGDRLGAAGSARLVRLEACKTNPPHGYET